MKIRRAKIEDLDELNNLAYDFLDYEKQNHEKSYEPEYVFTEGALEYKKKIIESDKGLLLVAEDDRKIVGFLTGRIGKTPDARKTMKPAVLDEIFITEVYRGQGIGEKMMIKFEGWAKKHGANKIRVSTGHERALRFYKGFGFKEFNVKLEKDI